MALGFGFNKQKVLAAAEKAVQQGKLQNAIAEYEKVIKEDPKDLTVLNTIGDLYSRIGNNDKSAIYFKKVGDIYASEGFTVKAIAMYKKLTKSSPGNIEAVQRLAELYTQQGLYNDAKAQYVVVAEQGLKAGDLEAAATSFRKILELDPENTAMQGKLADTYIKLGKRPEAQNIFLTAAQNLYQRGAMDAADESLRRVLQLDPKNLDAVLLKGRIAADSGDAAGAVKALESIPDIDSRPEALQALLRSYILLGQFEQANAAAQKLLSVHNDISGATSYAEGLMNAGHFAEAIQVYDQYADKLLAANSKQILATLQQATTRIKDSSAALAGLLSLYKKAGEMAQIGEVTELLAHALVNEGKLQEAAELYKELATLEPENPLHHQNYKQLLGQMGQDTTTQPMSPEVGQQPMLVDEMEVVPPSIDQKYSDDLTDDLRAAITDSELFDSYNLPAKAVAPLETILTRAPRDAQLNQKLASLYARLGRFEEAAACCETLHSVYQEAGHPEHAQQYLSMGAKYRERASMTAAVPQPPPPAPAPAPVIDLPVAEAPAMLMETGVVAVSSGMSEAMFEPVAPLAASAPPAPELGMEVAPPIPAAQPPVAPGDASGAHEFDFSNEWESMTVTPEAPAAPALAGPAPHEVADQIKFFISQGMVDEARSALGQLEAAAPNFGELPELRLNLAAAAAPPPPATARPAEDATVAEFSFEAEAPAPSPHPPPPPIAVKPPAPVVPPPAPPKVVAPPPPKPAAPPVPPPPPPPAAKKEDVLSDFVLELDDALGDDFTFGGTSAKPAAPPPPKPKPAVVAAPPPPPAPPSPPPTPAQKAEVHEALADLFDEFKEDMEQSGGASDIEDPDTHYNLGVAFKEMGLLDEAIGELQKVCLAIDHGHPFSQVIQAYTWLANCFVEKGVPEAAVRWYEKALTTPNLDGESRMAVHYELASAHAMAGDKQAALKNFMEVYGSNIDYRDVAQRIKELRS